MAGLLLAFEKFDRVPENDVRCVRLAWWTYVLETKKKRLRSRGSSAAVVRLAFIPCGPKDRFHPGA